MAIVRTKAEVAAALLLSLCPCVPAFSEDAQAMYKKMQDALGGAEKIAAIKEFEQTQSAESFDASGFAVLRSGHRVAVARSLDEVRINKGLKLEDLSAKPSDGKPVFAQPAAK